MRYPFRFSILLGALMLIGAIGFLFWVNSVRAQRVANISALAQAAPPVTDAASPTGYAGGIRELIVPEHNNDSYQWLAQTQLMLTRHEWRLRHVDYDNAPSGRDIRSPSPYRWWLGFVAWIEHARSGVPTAAAVERAALHANPALQVILLVFTAILVAWRFGAVPAALLCAGFTFLFPFATAFLPGQVDDYGISLVGGLWSVLPLVAAVLNPTAHRSPEIAAGSKRRWFLLAGIAGGFSLWISIVREVPVLTGIGLGAVIAAILTRRDANTPRLPWRAWALGGAGASLLAYLIEYFPSHLALKDWPLETVHPLYAIAWLGFGDLLARCDQWLRDGKSVWNRRSMALAAVSVFAVAAAPAAVFFQEDRAWLSGDAFASRLSNLSGAPVAESVTAWLARDHFNAAIAATFLPLLLLVPAIWLLARRVTALTHRLALSMALGPLLVALCFACFQLRWWHFVDVALLVLIVIMTAVFGPGRSRWLWTGLVALVLVPGLMQSLPPKGFASAETVTETEVLALVERDIAHWLANRVGPDGAIVLAPPGLTTSLYFHGGLRGIGTPYAGNKEGFAAAVRLSAASSADEAQALIRKRNVTHIVMPSWDPFLDDYARLGSTEPEHSLVGLLHQWLPPRWLRPVPYHLPQIPGFEGRSIAIFEVVDVQDNATALSNLAEYFAEMEMLDQAAAVRHALQESFPTEIGPLVAQAQVSMALRDGPAFTRIVNALVPRLADDEAQGLAWERRVSLAIVLAEAKRNDAAREQMERCLAEMDERLMRSLSPAALYRLQVLAKAYGLEIAEPSLRELAHTLLPPELRSAL